MLKKFHIHALLLLIVMSCLYCFFSCKKENNNVTINGNVYDPNTNVYVSNARVILSSNTPSSGFYSNTYTELASATTDNSGSFRFEFKKERAIGYRITILKDNYIDISLDIPGDDWSANNTYTPTYYIKPVGYLSLHIRNTSPINSADYIRYSFAMENPSCNTCCTDVIHYGNGVNYDTTYTCKTYGSQPVIANWLVSKMGQITLHADTFFCQPFDTTHYEINY